MEVRHAQPAIQSAVADPGAEEANQSGRERNAARTFGKVLEVGANVARAIIPGGSMLPDPNDGAHMDQMWQMQEDQRGFQLELIALQQSIQQDHQQFSTLSNVIKARHDTAQAAISNIRS